MTKNSELNKQKDVILIVDDDSIICEVCQKYLTVNGFDVRTANCSLAALEILDKTRVDLVITNIRMPGMNGLEFTRLVRDQYDLNVIVQTGYSGSWVREEAVRAGAVDFYHKPGKLNDLLATITRALSK